MLYYYGAGAYDQNKIQRGVAQFGRALRSGRRGRKFESCHLDQKPLNRSKTPIEGFLD